MDNKKEMIFDDILIFVGGLALFLYGMHLMGRGLTDALGAGLERAVKRFSLSGWRAVAAGAGVTALLQSSSAVTVMVVELVETGVLGLEQAVGLIIGANIGTTATAWIVAAGSTVPAEPVLFFGILGIAGVVVLLCSGREKLKETAVVLIGMELLFFGIDRMGAAVEPLGGMPNVRGWLVRSLNPVAGVLAGAAFTAIIQSSSASVGMLQMLAETGRLTYGNVIPLLLGQSSPPLSGRPAKLAWLCAKRTAEKEEKRQKQARLFSAVSLPFLYVRKLSLRQESFGHVQVCSPIQLVLVRVQGSGVPRPPVAESRGRSFNEATSFASVCAAKRLCRIASIIPLARGRGRGAPAKTAGVEQFPYPFPPGSQISTNVPSAGLMKTM